MNSRRSDDFFFFSLQKDGREEGRVYDRAGEDAPCVRATWRGGNTDLSQLGGNLQRARGMQVRFEIRAL